MPLFSFSKPDPVQQAREWKRHLTQQGRLIEREIRGIEREEIKVKQNIKQAAKRGDTQSAKTMARELLMSRKHKERLYQTRAHLNSVAMQLQSNIATIKIAGCMKKSTEIMSGMNELVRLPELNKIMMDMSREMEKAGLIDEMMDETFELDDIEDIDSLADEEVEKVFLEVTAGVMDKAAPAGRTALPQPEPEPEPEPEPIPRVSELDASLEARLLAL